MATRNEQNKRPAVPTIAPAPISGAVKVAEKEEKADPIIELKSEFRTWLKKPTVANRKTLSIMMDQWQDGFLVRQIEALNKEFGTTK